MAVAGRLSLSQRGGAYDGHGAGYRHCQIGPGGEVGEYAAMEPFLHYIQDRGLDIFTRRAGLRWTADWAKNKKLVRGFLRDRVRSRAKMLVRMIRPLSVMAAQ